MILSHDRERGRVSLSTKKLEPTPGDMIRNPKLVFEKVIPKYWLVIGFHYVKMQKLKVDPSIMFYSLLHLILVLKYRIFIAFTHLFFPCCVKFYSNICVVIIGWRDGANIQAENCSSWSYGSCWHAEIPAWGTCSMAFLIIQTRCKKRITRW